MIRCWCNIGRNVWFSRNRIVNRSLLKFTIDNQELNSVQTTPWFGRSFFKNSPIIIPNMGSLEIARGGIWHCRQCQRKCKIFASGENFSIFTHFLFHVWKQPIDLEGVRQNSTLIIKNMALLRANNPLIWQVKKKICFPTYGQDCRPVFEEECK